MRRRRHADRRESGQALIEFAFVAPLLLLILWGIFDLASGLNYLNDETNMTNVVARYASVLGSASAPPSCGSGSYTPDDVYGFVKCEAAADSAAFASKIGVCVTDETTSDVSTGYNANDALKITVEYPYNWLKIVGQSTVTLSTSATMMLEASVPSSSTTLYDWLYETDADSSDTLNPASNGSAGYTQCSSIT
ncbi:MAG: TadE/TadG family type IV pilus assembly protein [Solirubrobacteraceae bacterium]